MSHDGCPTRQTLVRYSVGKLPREGHEWVDRHLDFCQGCVDKLDEIGDVTDPLVDVLRQPVPANAARDDDSEFQRGLSLVKQIGRQPPDALRAFTHDKRTDDAPPRILGDYRLVREIARGGMGVVYEAEQVSLQRRVALKVLPFAGLLDQRQLQRFKIESQAAAQLHHGNIVPIYGVGRENGVHFYAMQYIEGQTLAALIGDLRHLSGPEPSFELRCPDGGMQLANSFLSGQLIPAPRQSGALPSTQARLAGDSEAAVAQPETQPVASLTTEHSIKSPAYFRSVTQLGRQVAEALDYAHQHGVVHRDVKPSNLLLDERGNVWLTDFGLARVEQDAGLTMTGDVMGTLRYMSPEQALGKREAVDHRSDVYSLGVTLYELLTLETVFPDSHRQELIAKITTEEPRPPRTVNSAVPKDLETVVLKSMAKDSADRYSSAAEFADDLRRFLDHKPIQAKRPSISERSLKWMQRHTGATVAILAVVGATIVLAAGLAVYNVRLSRLNTRLEESNAALDDSGSKLADSNRRLAQSLGRSRQLLYAADMKFAYQALEKGDLRQVAELLDRHVPQSRERDNRGVEWHYLKSRIEVDHVNLPGHTGAAYFVCYSPDGRWMATAGEDATVRILDAATFEEQRSLQTGEGTVNGVAFSPDCRTIASASDGGKVHIWSLDSESEPRIIQAHEGDADAVLFTSDGARLVSSGNEPTIRIWDSVTGEAMGVLEGHTRGSEALALSPDGESLGSASDDGTVRLWNLNTYTELSVWRGSAYRMVSIAFSADGRLVVAGGIDKQVHVWDRATGSRIFSANHPDGVQSVDFAPDGSWIVAGDRGGTIRLWRLNSSPIEPKPKQERDSIVWTAHTGRVFSVSVSPDGGRIASAGQDGAVRNWSPFSRITRRRVDAHGRLFSDIAFTADSRYLLTVDSLGELLVWDAATGTCAALFARHNRGLASIALSRDGRLMAASDSAGTVLVWDLTSRMPPAVWADDRRGIVVELEFSKDGARLAFGCDPGPGQPYTVQLLDVHSGNPIPGFESIPGLRPTFSPDGTKLAVAAENDVHVWELATGEKLLALRGHTNTATDIVFSPDGRLLASASNDRRIKLWDLADVAERHTLSGHEDKVLQLSFSPDGRSLLSAGFDGMLKVWQVSSGQELIEFDREPVGYIRLLMSRDGRWLAGLVKDEIVIHDLGHQVIHDLGHQSVTPMGPITESVQPKWANSPAGSSDTHPADIKADLLLRNPPPDASSHSHRVLEGHTGRVGCVAIHADGTMIASGSQDGTVRLWEQATARHLKTLEGHAAEVTSIAFQPRRNLLASGSLDGTVRLWDLDPGTEAGPALEHASAVVSIGFHPDGAALLTADKSGRVTTWDVETAKALQIEEADLNFVYGVTFSTDCRMLAARGPRGFLTIIDLGKMAKRLTLSRSSPVCFSPDGTILAAKSERYGVSVQFWDAKTGDVLHALRGHTGLVFGGQFSPDGRRLATVSIDHTLRLWDAATGEVLRALHGHRGPIDATCFSPDGKTLVTGGWDGTVRIWDLSGDE